MSNTEITKDYYNSSDADTFYFEVWGGEDIHIGIYENTNDIRTASKLTVERIADMINPFVSQGSTILDIGSGYGGAARYIAKRFNCRVICLNLSDVENKRNRQINKQLNLTDKISVIDGSFEEIPKDNATIDVVWSQDAMLHSGAKEQIFKEVSRVLKDNGRFVFTDPMQSDTADTNRLQPVYDRIHLESMGSFSLYKKLAANHNLTTNNIIDLTDQLPIHYQYILDNLESNEQQLKSKISKDYIDRMKIGLKHWVDAGNRGDLSWGILEFERQPR
ncbi:MAG: methyltransferase domain-containing protein [Leptonema sp. (in: Bacteria)]|nr:methyltransferase domain-containing protein [Leptonema sp. (in: bacteria)]